MIEEDLAGIWIIDPIQGTRLAAFRRHYEKHGLEVGAENEEQYLRKATEFARSRSGRTEPVEGMTSSVRRWRKAGRYIDMTMEGEIVSFGASE